MKPFFSFLMLAAFVSASGTNTCLRKILRKEFSLLIGTLWRRRNMASEGEQVINRGIKQDKATPGDMDLKKIHVAFVVARFQVAGGNRSLFGGTICRSGV